MINNKISILYVFLIFLFLIPYISSLTANSSNYSVGKFSSGLSASNASSDSYESLSLSGSQGTTRNAESDTYTTNVGFFDNTPYYRTVSINSYSVYPSSSEAVSSIRLYISALNYESVWASITRPDSVVDRVELSNNDYEYYTAGIVGRYNITFYANSSLGAISSVISYFDVTEKVVVNQPSGGGSNDRDEEKIAIVEECTYFWDCTPWGACSGGNQTRKCVNIGSCNGTQSKPLEKMPCSEALFDISLVLKDIGITNGSNILFNISLTEKMGVESIDVNIKYSIINKEGYEIFSLIETKAVQGSLNYEKNMQDMQLPDGEYTLRVDVLYGNLQRAFTEQKFKIVKGEIVNGIQEEGVSLQDKQNIRIIYLIAISILILIVLFALIFFVRKRYQSGGIKLIEENIKEGLNLLKEGRMEEARGKYRNIQDIYHLMGHTNNSVYSKVIAFYNKLSKN